MAVIQAIRNVLNLDATPTAKLPAKWPPTKADEQRISDYAMYREIWNGDHCLALDEQDISGRYGQYVTVNLARMLVTIPADFLFGEEFELTFDDDVSEEQQDQVKEILARSEELIRETDDTRTMFYESKLDAGIDGDAVILVERNEQGLAVLRPQPVSEWCPEVDPDNQRKIVAHWIGWKRTVQIANKERDFLRLVKHERGIIRNYVVEINKDGSLSPDNEEGWNALYPAGTNRPEKVIDTGIAGFALEHVPNWRTAKDLFGRAECKDLGGIFASLNARITQSDQILHRHSDPMLSLPAEVYQALRAQYGDAIPKDKLDVISQGENQETPEYAVWDGKLADNIAYVDKLISLIAIVSETAPQLLNEGEWGADLSGKALKILLIRTLAKVNRSRLYYSVAIPNLLVKAQQVEGVAKPVRPTIKWPDGLPQDILEAIEVAERAQALGISSPIQSAMDVYDISEDAAKERVDKATEHQDAERNSEALAQATMLGPQGQGRKNPIQVNLGR